MYTAFYACVYIYRRQEVREGDFESKMEISLSCQLIAGNKTIYSIYIPYIYVKWIYTVYIYTRTVTISQMSVRRQQRTLGVSTEWVGKLLSFFPATLLILGEFL